MISLLVCDLMSARRSHPQFLEAHLGLTPALRIELCNVWDPCINWMRQTMVQSNYRLAIS
jgi:hypothetical protein